jgi:hypothetical protein
MKRQAMAEAAETVLAGKGWLPALLRGARHQATLKALYGDPATKDSTRRLVNDLLPLGSGLYWRLKEAPRE